MAKEEEGVKYLMNNPNIHEFLVIHINKRRKWVRDSVHTHISDGDRLQ